MKNMPEWSYRSKRKLLKKWDYVIIKPLSSLTTRILILRDCTIYDPAFRFVKGYSYKYLPHFSGMIYEHLRDGEFILPKSIEFRKHIAKHAGELLKRSPNTFCIMDCHE